LYATGPSDAGVYPNAQVGLSSAMGAWAGGVSLQDGAGDTTPHLNFETENFVGFFTWEGQAGVVVNGVEAARAVVGTVTPIEDPTVQAAFAGGWVAQVLLFAFTDPDQLKSVGIPKLEPTLTMLL